MTDIYNRIFTSMETIGVLDVRHYAVIENPPYTPLCIDRLGEDTFALAQNRIENGTFIPDPDIEVRVDMRTKTAEPLVGYSPDGKKVVYPAQGRVDLTARNELTVFLDHWLQDLIKQGFIRQNLP